MNNLRIIYPQENGIACIIIPIEDSNLTIQEIARKDVPAGIPYKIVNVTTIPTDRTFRNAWECVIDVPDGYGIGQEAWFAERESTT